MCFKRSKGNLETLFVCAGFRTPNFLSYINVFTRIFKSNFGQKPLTVLDVMELGQTSTKTNCTVCNGTGKVKHELCNGTGHILENYNCIHELSTSTIIVV